MKIITISREFGSGGREIGKRLADILGFDYYDREILTAISESNNMDEEYIKSVFQNHYWQTIPITYHHSFDYIALNNVNAHFLSEHAKLLREIANSGKDCIIVGRHADYILKDFKPLNLFICSSMKEKVERCKARANENEHLTDKQIAKKIEKIEKNRAKTREIVSGKRWGHSGTYHLTVNTAGWEIKELTPYIADFANAWFNKGK